MFRFSVNEALEIEEESWSWIMKGFPRFAKRVEPNTFCILCITNHDPLLLRKHFLRGQNKYLTIKRTLKEVKIFDLYYKYVWSGQNMDLVWKVEVEGIGHVCVPLGSNQRLPAHLRQKIANTERRKIGKMEHTKIRRDKRRLDVDIFHCEQVKSVSFIL